MNTKQMVVAWLVLAMGAAGCHRAPTALETKSLPPAEVRVQTVQSGRHTVVEEAVGTVRAKLRATIEAKVSGRIAALRVAPGQMVKTGELLLQLDVQEIQARLDQAVALRQQAETDLKRISSLLQQGVSTQQEYDQIATQLRVAVANMQEMETMLGYAKVTAPFDGVITRKLADVGDLAAPGKALLEMEDPRSLRLEADVPEALIGQAQMGAKMRVVLGPPLPILEGTVSEADPVADPNSRTYRVKLDLPPAPGLRAGQFGRVEVPVSENEMLRVPVSALVVRGQMEIVFVAKDQRAELRLVKTGKTFGNDVEILAGLTKGESVVASGATLLTDGQPLVIR